LAVKLTGARIFLECLKREGVDVLFGLPGGAVLYAVPEREKEAVRMLEKLLT